MDDDPRGMRRSKPQQQFYFRGSGPLKKSPTGPEDMDNGKTEYRGGGHEGGRRGHGRPKQRGGNRADKDAARFGDDLSERLEAVDISQADGQKQFKQRKPEQQMYAPKFANKQRGDREDGGESPAPGRNPGDGRFADDNSQGGRPHGSGIADHQNNHDNKSKRYSGNRRQGRDGDDDRHRRTGGDGRQNSEPRNVSPPRKNMNENHSSSRNRDTRSMDSSAPRLNYHSNGGKPPSGRRNSTAPLGMNLEAMAPRFRKKILAESGILDPDASLPYQGSYYSQQQHPPQHPPSVWSHTLPSRGRGRLRDEDFDREKAKRSVNAYMQSFESGDSGSSTPYASFGLSRSSYGPPGFIGSHENIHSEKSINHNMPPMNRHSNRNDAHLAPYFKNFRPQQMDNANQDYNDRLTPHSMSQSTDHLWNSRANSVDNSQDTRVFGPSGINSLPPMNSSTHSEPFEANKLLEKITSMPPPAAGTGEYDDSILNWTEELEKITTLEQNLQKQSMQTQLSGSDKRPTGGQSGDGRHQDKGDKGAPPPRQGDGKQGQGRNSSGRRRKRSSSRGSQRREPSSELIHQRSDRSPNSQGQGPTGGQGRDFRDHYRENKEIGANYRDGIDKDAYRDGRQVHHRIDYNEPDRPNSRNQWPRNQYSRENSRDRYSYSRGSSGERGPGSRTCSRERPPHPHLAHSHNRGQNPAPIRAGSRIDQDGFRLPPPPPPQPNAQRNSRNQNRRDSWSARGSRHASCESGGGEMSPARSVVPAGGGSGGGGGGGGRRRHRRESDVHRHLGANPAPTTNWREEMQPSNDRNENEAKRGLNRNDSIGSTERLHEGNTTGKGLAPGILVLPHESAPERTKNMEMAMHHHQNRGPTHHPSNNNNVAPQAGSQQRTLFDPRNPNKPILIGSTTASSARIGDSPPVPHHMSCPPSSDSKSIASNSNSQAGGRPAYYDVNSDSFKSSRNQDLLRDVERADLQLQWIFKNGDMLRDWDRVMHTRPFLQQSLQTLLKTDLKFCQTENVEHHFWKMLYYSFIEALRKAMGQDEANKSQYSELINSIIKDGNTYFENLLECLQTTYKFKLDDYLNANFLSPPKGLGFVGLALVSVQKIYIFLGDLARYKERVNETSNYAKSKNWYTKAHQINPKNGRPYNQLAILAVYARRKLDAVYFYMRSLMSSNPFDSARESLIALFDENRKKYEGSERKRLAERQRITEGQMSAASGNGVRGKGNSLRREVWSRVGGGRTTTLLQPDKLAARAACSDDAELAAMTSIELNKRFITSYLHVHGKLITKIGMETFSESAAVMLRQFRALLRHSPLPINCSRLLQLTALNVFAIESAHLKNTTRNLVGGAYRSEQQERALAVSLRMFGALLERCCSLLATPPGPEARVPVHEDVLVILPALKVWSDWMLCHSAVWNPPPSCDDFDVGSESDPWSKLAKLMNLLEPLDFQGDLLRDEKAEDHEIVRLPEDARLAGFTPLMYGAPEAAYAPRSLEPEAAQLAMRARKLLFFGTQFLCGLDPPPLERQLGAAGTAEYVSVVRRRRPAEETADSREARANSSDESDIMEASLSEEEECAAGDAEDVSGSPPVIDWASCVETSLPEVGDKATQDLLKRRGVLEHRRRDQERRTLRMQSLLKQGQVSVELEVRPRYLVPDTNCFIDHLPRLQRLMAPEPNSPYILVVPLVVVSELEGLTRAARLSSAARTALSELRVRRPALRFATTRGSLLVTPAFTAEKDGDEALTNDDRILAASLSLCKNAGTNQHLSTEAGEVSAQSPASPLSETTSPPDADGVRRLVREVVLLTDDRNLRVKALARDLPVRDLPAFMRWAALD